MLPSKLLHIHREKILEIMARYPLLANLRVVGSVARGEDTENSDIDFLVDKIPGATLFDLGGLYEDFGDLLGVPVSILTSGPHLGENMRMSLDRDAVCL
jgi:predicted nucleotidyltransferase